MRLSRSPAAATNEAPTGKAAIPRGHRAGAGLARLVSVTAVVAATCALWALPASAATANVAGRYGTSIMVSATPARAFAGAPVRLSAKVRSRVGTPAGSVTFTWRRTRLCVARLRRGAGSCWYRFPRAGIYWVRGTYARHPRYWGSWRFVRVVIVRRGTSTMVSATPARAYTGAPVRLSARVRSRVGIPAGSVTFTWGRTRLCVARLRNGSGSCLYRFSRAGIYWVRGTYARHPRYWGSWRFVRVVIVRRGTSTMVSATPARAYTGAPVRLSARVRSRVGIPGGSVTFTWRRTRLCVARLRRGSGSCLYRFPRAGIYWVRGTYARNPRYWGSWHFVRVVIVNPPPHATTTAITNPSPGTVLAGHPFTVDVSVTSASGTPTGTVVVAPTSPKGLPASYSCTATLKAGKGSCAVTPGAGTFGDIFYEATYSGDATHTKSVSTGTHELIVPETTTTSVTPATAVHGSVTLTATVVGQAKGNISPSAGGTGTVTFTITQGSTTVATCSKAALTYNGGGGNLATCTATLAAGSYTVTAVYSGDPNNLTSKGTETLTVS